MKRTFVSTCAALFVAGLLVSASTIYTTANGTWTAHPGQSIIYGAAIQQPINADGSSNFKANGKAVIPIKFALSQGTGPFVFESIFSDAATTNDYSFLLVEVEYAADLRGPHQTQRGLRLHDGGLCRRIPPLVSEAE